MSTPDSIKAQIQSLISTANTTTGKSDTDLTAAITSLISGYGGGGDVAYNGLRYNEGTVLVENGIEVFVNHNSGFSPEIFILYPKFDVTVGSANEEVAFIGYYGNLLGGVYAKPLRFVLENRTSYTSSCVWFEASSGISNPTETRIRIPYRSSAYPFRVAEYGWIAIAEKGIQSGGESERSVKKLFDLTKTISFYGNTNLVEFADGIIEFDDTSNVTDMSNSFYGCSSLISIPSIDTRKVTSMSNMFDGCKSLKTVPLLATQSVWRMSRMFNDCESLEGVPLFDTQNVIQMDNMFRRCISLTSVPEFNTSKVKGMSYLFSGCSLLVTIPSLDTQKVTDMSYMFNRCTALVNAPSINTQNVTNMSYMFRGCTTLVTIPLLDATKATNMSYMFDECPALQEVRFVSGTIKVNLSLSASPNLSDESIQSIIDGLATLSKAQTLTLHATVKAKLTEEQIAQITAKNWTLA